MMKVCDFDTFSSICPYFNSTTDVNNGYGCDHPEQEETDMDHETGKEQGKCYCFSCPFGFELGEEDFSSPNIDFDGLTKEECMSADGTFVAEGDYLVVNADDSEEHAELMREYEAYIGG